MCWREIRKGQAGATKISSPSGKTLTLTFPSSSKPGQSSRNWSNSNAPTKTAKRLDTPKVPRHNEVTFATDDRRFSRLVPSHGQPGSYKNGVAHLTRLTCRATLIMSPCGDIRKVPFWGGYDNRSVP